MRLTECIATEMRMSIEGQRMVTGSLIDPWRIKLSRFFLLFTIYDSHSWPPFGQG